MAKRRKAAKSAETAASKERGMAFIKPFTECPVFYSNIGQVTTSRNDVRMVLGNALDPTDTEYKVSPQVVVYLPHAHAKRIAEIILEQAKKMEKMLKASSEEPTT